MAFLCSRIWLLSINLINESKLQIAFSLSGFSYLLEIIIFLATGIKSPSDSPTQFHCHCCYAGLGHDITGAFERIHNLLFYLSYPKFFHIG